MKLQILVPHFSETFEEVEPLLDSLALQQSIDFDEVGVVIAYDGPDAEELCREPDHDPRPSGDMGRDDLPIWAMKYPFAIEHVRVPEHVGVSACRNAALDAATADYVMFCDADDMFCDMCGLHLIFREIDNGGFDTMVSCFREETRYDGQEQGKREPVYINHDMDQTFVHGKVHNRKYLVDNSIRFNPKLTVHEDSYFNILAQSLAAPDRAKYCPMPFYLWRWRDASVCRHDKDYILKTYVNMLDSNDALIDEFVRRMRDDKANFYVGFMIFDAYYTMNKPEWIDKVNAGYREKVERRFAEYYEKHRTQWDKLTNQERMQISTGVRARSAREGMLMEAITLEQWLDKVSGAYRP